MGDVVLLPRPEFEMDLDEADRTKVLRRLKRLPGEWRAKFIRQTEAGKPCGRWFAYIFNAGPAADVSPVFTVSRTSRAYTVVSWDLLNYFCEGYFEDCRAGTIDDALSAITEIVDCLPFGDEGVVRSAAG